MATGEKPGGAGRPGLDSRDAEALLRRQNLSVPPGTTTADIANRVNVVRAALPRLDALVHLDTEPVGLRVPGGPDGG